MDDEPFFDDEAVADAAADADVPAADLHDLIETHQARMRELPGIDELVYEWRKTLREDPLLYSGERAYYVALPRRIWRQFADAYDLNDAEFEALLSVHDRAVRATVDGLDDGALAGADRAKLDEDVGMVLLKD